MEVVYSILIYFVKLNIGAYVLPWRSREPTFSTLPREYNDM